ncbi:MAG: SurA N-terminal domain-containing protein [Deltaproteobacteria bacterium]|jgi:peptidyl-prolyl cis-trans isomerase SurA|nr:SurA N-terminal domain-containing protein [Deltaproteobacteria bacterium]
MLAKSRRALLGALAVTLGLIWVGTLFPARALAETKVDRIVAQVNRNIITLSELEARVRALSPPQKAALAASGGLERQVLDMLVEEELLNQAAQKIGIMVMDAEVTDAIQSIMADNNINQAQFRQSLEASGTTVQAFREQLRTEILKNKVLGYSVRSKIVVTEEEVTKFLIGQATGDEPNASPTGVSDYDAVRIIFLPSTPQRAGQVVAQARQIKAEIENGLSFADAARKYSKGPGAENGGDPGELTVIDLQPELRDLARTLVPGTVSEPLNGGEVVLLITILPAGEAFQSADSDDPQSFTPERRARARRQLEMKKTQAKFETWLEEQKTSAVIKITL